jgi:hypothetical protein
VIGRRQAGSLCYFALAPSASSLRKTGEYLLRPSVSSVPSMRDFFLPGVFSSSVPVKRTPCHLVEQANRPGLPEAEEAKRGRFAYLSPRSSVDL